jgi:hypothetical protein
VPCRFALSPQADEQLLPDTARVECNCQDFSNTLLEGLLIDLEFPEVPTPLTQKVAKGIGEFETYIRNNEEFIPNFGRPSLNRQIARFSRHATKCRRSN